MNFVDFVILMILGGISLYIAFLKIRTIFLVYKIASLKSDKLNSSHAIKENRGNCNEKCEFCPYKL